MFKSRTRFIIYPKFQWTLIAGQFVCILIVLSGIIASVNLAINQLIADGTAAGLSADHPYFNLLQYQKKTILYRTSIVCAVGFVLSVLWMVLVSHKVAGPIVRLRNYFANFKTTPYHPISFRKGDFFTELPPVINEVLGGKKG